MFTRLCIIEGNCLYVGVFCLDVCSIEVCRCAGVHTISRTGRTRSFVSNVNKAGPQESESVYKTWQRTQWKYPDCKMSVVVGGALFIKLATVVAYWKENPVVLADAVFCTVVTPNSKDDKCKWLCVQNVRCVMPCWESVGEDFLIYVLHILDWNWRVLVLVVSLFVIRALLEVATYVHLALNVLM